MKEPFTARTALLAEVFALRAEHERLRDRGSEPLHASSARLLELIEAYRAATPILALSRCPFCGEVVRHSFDPHGLDGLWWDYKHPTRPFVEARCPHQLAFTGAVRLDRDKLENAPILALPGPEAPFVVPSMLEAPDTRGAVSGRGPAVRAVISSVRVGPHVAFPIFYFADPIDDELELINDWGSDVCRVTLPDGSTGWHEAPPDADEFDFELAPWIASGHVSYILPDDEGLTLCSEVAGCPYVGLPGRREIMKVQDGVAWANASEL